MRRDVQEIFKLCPHDKQVMMFSATLNQEIRPVCKKFMNSVKTCSHYNHGVEGGGVWGRHVVTSTRGCSASLMLGRRLGRRLGGGGSLAV